MKIAVIALMTFHLVAVAEEPGLAQPEPPRPPLRTETQAGSRMVSYAEQDVVTVKAKLRYMTLIVLPKQEQILDFTCGDKDWWVINGTANFAYIKPAKPGAQTNLNLITASGNVYSFVLNEVSETHGEPDLKIFVELEDGPMRQASEGVAKLYSAQQVADYREQIDIAKMKPAN